jgi:enediyne core biosynthesis thioesterase
MPEAFEYRHMVGFEETNLTGNVYYVNHLRWQGRCREAFLQSHAPEILDELNRGLALVTVRCSCEYLDEVFAFDEIVIRMRLRALTNNRVTMEFEYFREDQLIAKGEQQIACMRRGLEGMRAEPLPRRLYEALEKYTHPTS